VGCSATCEHGTLTTNKGDRMARGNGKTINVKLPTTKVIKALESALTKLEADYKSQDDNEAKYQKAYAKWQKDTIKYALDNVSKAENTRTNYRSWNNTLNIDFDIRVDEKDIPQMPERDFESMNINKYRDTKEEVENAIRILKMTDEETVSTSTYNSIARYL
jgi:hypothetical protein